MRYVSVVLASLLAVALAGLPVRGGEPAVRVVRDLSYGNGGDVDLKLDLAMPAEGKGPFPAVVCIHGGGWRAGERRQLDGLIKALAERGFVAVTITYRLAPAHPFPAQIEDAKAAVRWLRANAREYHVRADAIGALGFSAGAHLACLLGTADATAGLEGKGGNPKESSRVQAVVSFFGPTDFRTKTWKKGIEDSVLAPFMGGSYEEKKDAYRQASPMEYISKDDPPFLFFHGAKDTLVGIENSENMVKKLKETGVYARLVALPDAGHGWAGPAMRKSIAEAVEFLGEKLKK